MTRDITPAGSPATGAVDEAFAEVRASFDLRQGSRRSAR